jgi:hypothetical protein
MSTIDCNADLGHPCDADDGEPCPSCVEDAAYWRYQYQRRGGHYRECCGAASGQLCEPGCDGGEAEYRREMIDAGRGHLLGGA